MLFNSIHFVVFFPLVVLFFFILPHRFRWFLLLTASYYFYMCWKPVYILLIVLSTLIDYLAALGMHSYRAKKPRILFLTISIVCNLSLLFVFKYFGFFNEALQDVLSLFSISYEGPAVRWLLPVGISFYTFQSMSYTIDVFRGERDPERHFGRFALYVAFFPQLVAGPIERSTRLLAQFEKHQTLDVQRIISGLQLMLWGFFKKLVIADRLAVYVDAAYNDPSQYAGAPILLATYFFAFQIYCDFSGYSDIARGAARVFGIQLMVNFNRPYFAQSIGDFWRRWHISLSTWFRDYLYVPLGGNRVSPNRWRANIVVVFVLSGIWHGANWTFLVWGALHAFYLILGVATSDLRNRLAMWTGYAGLPRVRALVAGLTTFHLVLLSWVMFRAQSLHDAAMILGGFLDRLFTTIPAVLRLYAGSEFGFTLLSLAFLMFVEAISRGRTYSEWYRALPLPCRWAMTYLLLFGILLFGVFNETEFYYFQF